MIGYKVEIEIRRKTEVSDGVGGMIVTWQGLRILKGVMTPVASLREREIIINDKLTVVATHYFFMNYPIGLTITEEDILVLENKTYEIIYVEDISLMKEKRLKLTIKVKI